MKPRNYIFIAWGLFCIGIARAEVKLKLKQTASVSVGGSDGSSKTYNAGEIVVLKATDSALIESHGHVPLLVIPSIGEAQIDVTLPNQEEWPPQKTQNIIDQKSSELVRSVFLAQKHIQEKRYAEALKILEDLQIQSPAIKEIAVLRISTLILLGRRQEAASIIKLLLKTAPDEELSRLLSAISKSTPEKGETR